ncbi:MAG: hypothetical protein Fur0032_09620 [Terrimicrobiaceae bacterium]
MRLSGLRAALIAGILLLAAVVFVERAFLNAREVNTRIDRTDQNAYIDHALRLKESGYQYDLPRNRMPVYPMLLSLLVQEGDSPGDLFSRGKTANIVLTMSCLVVVATVFFRVLPPHAALNATLFAAFSVFLFKAPHVQAEILFYTLNFVGFVLAWKLFLSPRWKDALWLGLTAAAAHLTKASILPGLFCFSVFFLADASRSSAGPNAIFRRLGLVVLTLLVFLGVTAPYLIRSKELHGSFFYNVNSTHYFWLDSWKECVALTQKAKELGGWSALPPEEQPGPAFFLRRHGPEGIVTRLVSGSTRVVHSMRSSYGYFGVLLALSAALAVLAFIQRIKVQQWIRERPAAAAALAAYFGGYFLLLAWYSQIIDGNRFILALFLPAVFTLFVGIHRLSRGLQLTIKGKTWPVASTLQFLLSLWLAIEITIICTSRIGSMYGGG